MIVIILSELVCVSSLIAPQISTHSSSLPETIMLLLDTLTSYCSVLMLHQVLQSSPS